MLSLWEINNNNKIEKFILAWKRVQRHIDIQIQQFPLFCCCIHCISKVRSQKYRSYNQDPLSVKRNHVTMFWNHVVPVYCHQSKGSKKMVIPINSKAHLIFSQNVLDFLCRWQPSIFCIHRYQHYTCYWYSVLKDSAKKFELEICANIIPHLILSFFILYTSSGRYFAIFGVILITPAAPVVICTKYGPAKWHSTYFLKMRILRHCFRISTARNRFYDVYH